MQLIFEPKAIEDEHIRELVENCLKEIKTLEDAIAAAVIIFQDEFQDGKSKAYYIKCNISASDASPLLDMDAKLNPADADSFRANRQLLTEHNTYKRMASDANVGREFNDIIVEYTKEYNATSPLKIWGGQHRARAIQEAYREVGVSLPHGFRIYFSLSKQQRTELALISNTNISVSNDLFDRMLEETFVGLELRDWCYKVGLLKKPEDFPDEGSRAERLTVKLARTFVTNFYQGREKGTATKPSDLDKNVYEPHLCESGVELDPVYKATVTNAGPSIWADKPLLQAGKAFAQLHFRQQETIKQAASEKKLRNLKGFRNKALTESVISAWAFVAGLLQIDPKRLANHLAIPKTAKKIPDPLNAQEMSIFHHAQDKPTYRGLGTRSALQDRQRMAQVFLARSLKKDTLIDKTLMNQAVSQVVAIKTLKGGYAQ